MLMGPKELILLLFECGSTVLICSHHFDDIQEEAVTRYMYNPRPVKWKTDEIVVKIESKVRARIIICLLFFHIVLLVYTYLHLEFLVGHNALLVFCVSLHIFHYDH